MRVFISWSGDEAKHVAGALREWLPSVLQSVDPWMSEQDIAKGTRPLDEIAAQLKKARFGLVVLTRSNLTAPWLMFESGALSNKLQNRVSPVRVQVGATEVTGPLTQFQSVDVNSNEEMLKLLQSINEVAEKPIAAKSLKIAFDGLWSNLEARVTYECSESEQRPTRTDRDLLEEVLERVRSFDQSPSVLRSDGVRGKRPSLTDIEMVAGVLLRMNPEIGLRGEVADNRKLRSIVAGALQAYGRPTRGDIFNVITILRRRSELRERGGADRAEG